MGSTVYAKEGGVGAGVVVGIRQLVRLLGGRR